MRPPLVTGEPEPDMRLAGVSCPGCGESDVNWLQVQEGSDSIHCDHCGADFTLPVPIATLVPISDRFAR
jgi:transcription elongation factor Elf1